MVEDQEFQKFRFKSFLNKKTQVFLGFFYFKKFGFLIKYFKPGKEDIAAQNVKSSPILAANSGLKFRIGADDKKTYSLIPTPPKEKTEKIDDNINTNIISR